MTSVDAIPGAEAIVRASEIRAIIEQGDAEWSSCNNGPDAERVALDTIEKIRQLLGPAPVQPETTTPAPTPAIEIDEATGWPVFIVGGMRYAVGHRVAATKFSHVDYVPYLWLDALQRNKHHRAYADAFRGSTNRQIWDARYTYDVGRNA